MAIRFDGISELEVTESASQLAALTRLFSPAVFRQMGAKGRSGLFARLAREAGIGTAAARDTRVRDAFDAAFARLKQSGLRDEYVYKAALTRNILLGRHNLNTACMLTEFRAGGSKADVAILNGTTTVYEIKSERDSLARLQGQLADYRRVFASVVVIAAEKHVDAILRMTPADVGVKALTARHQIRTIREASDQPDRLCPLTILDAIRTDEAKAILAALGLPVPEAPNTRLRQELRLSFEGLAPVEVHRALLCVLKTTRDMRPLAAFVAGLPTSLRASALSVSLRTADRDRVFDAVNAPLEHALAWS